ncbi:MAG: integrase arm-type DNA-binding domain-containing protein, partial [Burkholderiales bacterium]|nr:integrase arm-type DNA-binding domain-containing protein [Burkholderiales bacterium]
MLSDSAIRKAKPSDKQFKMPDERGLQLVVRPNGSKLWQLRYRHQGKEKTASLGQYPDVSLAQAREKREALRQEIAQGIDPVQSQREKKAASANAAQHTFESVAREWWTQWKAARSGSHVQYVIKRLEQNVFPEIGNVPVSEVDAPQLVRLVKKVAQRGALDLAQRCLQMCNQVFRYAIAHGLATRNPATDIRPADVLPSRLRKYPSCTAPL